MSSYDQMTMVKRLGDLELKAIFKHGKSDVLKVNHAKSQPRDLKDYQNCETPVKHGLNKTVKSTTAVMISPERTKQQNPHNN